MLLFSKETLESNTQASSQIGEENHTKLKELLPTSSKKEEKRSTKLAPKLS